ARAPGDRHATARELADELEAAMAELGLSASHRSIGATITKLFEDVRAETKRAIEAKLGRASMTTPLLAVTGTTESRSARAARARRRWVVAATAAVVLTAAGAFAAWKNSTRATRTAAIVPVAAPSSPIATPAPPAPGAKPLTNLTATSPDA